MSNPVMLGLLAAALVIVAIVVGLLFQRVPVKRAPIQGPSAAMLALARGERARALQILRGSIDEVDVSVETMLVLGHLLREHGEIERALHVHHALLGRASLRPDQRRLIELQIVDDLLASDQNERAESRLAELDEHYEDEEILERRAMALVRLQRAADACEVLKRLAALDVGDGVLRAKGGDGIAEIAREQLRRGEIGEAARTAHAALDVDSHRAAAHAVLGDTQAATGDLEAAVSTWLRGLQRAPEGGPLLLGRVLEASLQKGRLEALVDVMAALREQHPEDPWLWRATADLRLRRGDREEFFALLDDAPLEAVERLDGWTGWIRHLHARGDEPDFRRLLAALPDAFGVRSWRCPACGREDGEARSACGHCGSLQPLRPVERAPAAEAPALRAATTTIPGDRLQ